MKKIIYTIPIISAGIFFYLGLNTNSINESVKQPIESKEIQKFNNIKNKDEENIQNKSYNYTIEHCKYDIRRLRENVQNLYLDKLFQIKKDKYINDKKTNCLVVYYLEIRPHDSDTKWLVEIEKNYPHLKPYEKALKLLEFQAPELERQRLERIEAQKIKIPDYVEDYDYVDYDSKTIAVFEEEIYEEEEVRIRNIDKDHNHAFYNPEYAEYPYSKKTTFDVKKLSDTILYFIGDKINNNDSNDSTIILKDTNFPIKFLQFEYKNKIYALETRLLHYSGFKKHGLIRISVYNNFSLGSLQLNVKNNELKGYFRLNGKRIHLNFKDYEGYIYTYKSNDPVVYTID